MTKAKHEAWDLIWPEIGEIIGHEIYEVFFPKFNEVVFKKVHKVTRKPISKVFKCINKVILKPFNDSVRISKGYKLEDLYPRKLKYRWNSFSEEVW